jgi:hypothetical protein
MIFIVFRSGHIFRNAECTRASTSGLAAHFGQTALLSACVA